MKYASVSEVVRRIKDDIQNDYWLKSVAMEGSIIGLKRASNGHYYMNIHDDVCSIRAILFRSRAGSMMESIREGDQVVVIGSVNVYEKGSSLSFIINRIFSQGMGTLQAEFERIRKELAREGYFDEDHKKAIPRFPWTIGVLTSRTGAVIHDICRIAAERNPCVKICLYPIPVQGAGAEKTIAETLEKAGRNTALDVIILARGGGSLEDLWCFNSPDVVKAVYDAAVPVVTAIGHETDTTLADYAADKRAATPTHAAEIAVPSLQEIELNLALMSDQAHEKMTALISRSRRDVAQLAGCVQPRRYEAFLAVKRAGLRQLLQAADHQCSRTAAEKRARLAGLQGVLQGLDPSALVRRGYGQLEQGGRVLSDLRHLRRDEPLYIQVTDGRITTEIKEVELYGKDDG